MVRIPVCFFGYLKLPNCYMIETVNPVYFAVFFDGNMIGATVGEDNQTALELLNAWFECSTME